MMTLDPRDRGTLPDLRRHPWVNMGQEEPLEPYCELSCDKDPGSDSADDSGLEVGPDPGPRNRQEA